MLRLAVNIINDRRCKYTSYSAALWCTSAAKLWGFVRTPRTPPWVRACAVALVPILIICHAVVLITIITYTLCKMAIAHYARLITVGIKF